MTNVDRPTTPRIGPTRVPRGVYILGAACVLGCAVWARWPLRSPPLETPTVHPTEVTPFTLAALDTDAFAAPIWIAEPPPPEPAPELPPPAPTRLRLIAIVRDGDQRVAALYDPDADRMLFASVGETVADLTVDSIDGRTVTFRDGRGTLTLAESPGGTP